MVTKKVLRTCSIREVATFFQYLWEWEISRNLNYFHKLQETSRSFRNFQEFPGNYYIFQSISCGTIINDDKSCDVISFRQKIMRSQ